MKTFTFLRVLFPLFAALGLAVNANSQGTPFGCSGQFYISHSGSGANTYTGNTALDSLTFSGTTFSAVNFPITGGMGFNAIGINPLDGFMYAVRYQSGAPSTRSHLIKIGRTSTNETDLGAITVGAGFITGSDGLAGCFDLDGTFYFSAGTTLYKITNASLSTAAATSVGTVATTFADMAIDPTTGTMYASSGGNTLYVLNKATGATTATHNFSTQTSLMAGLFFIEDGTLYGYRGDGTFWKIDKATGTLTAAGTATSYSNADGCSCSFRVGHTLTRTSFCPTNINPTPVFKVKIVVSNSSGAAQSALTFSLPIGGSSVDPAKRFRFISLNGNSLVQANIQQNIKDSLVAHGYLAAAEPLSSIVLGVASPASGTNYNTVTVSNFKIPFGGANKDSFQLGVQFYTSGTPYNSVSFQSTISGLPAGLGGTDLSGNGISPHAATVINFQDCGNITLPVKLLSFSGIYRNNASLLNWESENQVNFDTYEIQRSSNGSDFASVGIKAAQTGSGRLQYQFSDDLSAVTGNIFYYRLKMVDIDGKYSYSNVIMIRRDQKNINGISIIPNPVINDMATIRFTASAAGVAEIRIIDLSGKVVLHQQNKVYEGTNSISVNNLSRLQSGIYTLQVADGDMIMNNKFSIVK